jgi:ribonucleoside-diphosphate reductase alpha chain
MNVGVSLKNTAVEKPADSTPVELSPPDAGELLERPFAGAGYPIKLERPARVSGETIAINTSYGKMYLTINSINGEPFETFATVAKAGGMIQADLECVCRLISLSLRYRIPMHEITRQLIGIQDGNPYGVGANRVLSLWDAIAKALASFHPAEQRQESMASVLAMRPEGLPCPDCGAPLIHTENCEKCFCGYSRCW